MKLTRRIASGAEPITLFAFEFVLFRVEPAGRDRRDAFLARRDRAGGGVIHPDEADSMQRLSRRRRLRRRELREPTLLLMDKSDERELAVL